MTDEFHGVTRDEYTADRLLSSQDWADWRAIRGYERSRRPTRDEMVEHMAAERREWERQQLEGVAERAVVRDGWATGYPDEVLHPAYGGCEICHGRLVVVIAGPDENGQYDTDDCPCQLRATPPPGPYTLEQIRALGVPDLTEQEVDDFMAAIRGGRAPCITVHATLQLTGCGDPTIDELRAQLAGLGFDTIDIEEVGL